MTIEGDDASYFSLNRNALEVQYQECASVRVTFQSATTTTVVPETTIHATLVLQYEVHGKTGTEAGEKRIALLVDSSK